MPGAAAPADALSFKTDVSPEDLFVAIGRLRREARDEIDRLVQFLDRTDDYVSRELEDDGDAEPSIGVDDREPDLGSFDRMMNQELSNRQRLGEETAEVDAEQDQADSEPSLGSLEWASQTHWAAGDARDLEEGFETGLGGMEGLLEQIGTQDWQQGGMA
ncbi:hypothetical protein H8A97_29030 [Bradyrhizobium sp. Arg62]|uniref:hypothetical protein n=1 Tax=Bradyrhizobium brasilense TaxID=1419277 RepID=UPI001E412B37|nr:hypothetical protein [Bradyrhizobium brasilense]MCC8949036.1 hypothetical protein [Bradyrhizobium brasilense]